MAIDFKGVRDPGNQLTPNEKAKSFCEFLLKLTNGGKFLSYIDMRTR